jgi:undecaprenyl-diphosphatase
MGVARFPAVKAAVLAAGCFFGLAAAVVGGKTARFDESVLLAFREAANPDDPLGPARVEEMARDITGIGGLAVLGFMTVIVVGFFVLQRKWHLALYVAAAVAGGAATSSLLKAFFDRPRPDLVAHGQHVFTASFPSGHSMLSAVTFLTLGALLAGAQKERAMRRYVLAISASLTFAVGVSRVYLGVHWPTDVLGGWAAGAAWALGCWALSRFLRERGRLE